MSKHKILIGLFGFSLCVSLSGAQIGSVLLFLVFLWKLKDREFRKNISRPILFWPALASMGITFFVAALHPGSGTKQILSSQSVLLVYFLLAGTFSIEDADTLLLSLCWGAIFAGALGIIQKCSGVNFLPRELELQYPELWRGWPERFLKLISLRNERAVGPRSHPLTYAESLIPSFFLLIFCVVQAYRAEPRQKKNMVLWSLGLLLVTGGIVVAEGRAVLFGILVGSFFLGWSMGRRVFWSLTIIMLLGFSLSFVSSTRFRGRVLSAVSNNEGTVGDQQSKITRYTLWTESINIIAEHPVFGLGKERVFLESIDFISKTPRTWTETHNIFLQTLVESGIAGLGVFLWIWFGIFKLLSQMAKETRAAFLGCFVAFLVAGLTESWTNDKTISTLFWSVLGCAESIYKGRHDEA